MQNSETKKEGCGSRNFQETEDEIVAVTTKSLGRAYPVYWEGLELLKDVINLLIDDASNSTNEVCKKYSLAYLMLINRAIQHIESIRLLTERGLYGNSFVLIRSLMSDLSMMQYLHYHPEFLDLFLNEGQDEYQANKEFRKNFSESAIEADLVSRGVPPFNTAFQVLSKASHASSFGSQLFGSKGEKKGQYHFNYGPKFEAEKALLLIDLVASGHYDLVTNILFHRHHAKEELSTENWENVKKRINVLKDKILTLTDAVKATITTMFPTD